MPVGEAADLPGEPAEARGVPLLAVLEEHLEPDADAEEGDAVLLHPLGERLEQVGLAQRVERRRAAPTPGRIRRSDSATSSGFATSRQSSPSRSSA